MKYQLCLGNDLKFIFYKLKLLFYFIFYNVWKVETRFPLH